MFVKYLFNSLTYSLVAGWPVLVTLAACVAAGGTVPHTVDIKLNDYSALKILAWPTFDAIWLMYFSSRNLRKWLPDLSADICTPSSVQIFAISWVIASTLLSHVIFVAFIFHAFEQYDTIPKVVFLFTLSAGTLTSLFTLWVRASRSGFIKYIHKLYHQATPETRAVGHELDTLASTALSAVAGAASNDTYIEFDSHCDQDLADEKPLDRI